jgi:glycosyltransferase involved in cell wall biosynthesis
MMTVGDCFGVIPILGAARMQEHPAVSRSPIRVAIDARYVCEEPSGIGIYVRALIDRLPVLARDDQFQLWAHPFAQRPLSNAPNVSEKTVRPGPNSPLTIFWPRRYADFEGVDVFHNPHDLLPVGLPCPTVVTVHDTMAIDHPKLKFQGIERAAKSFYFAQSIWRALNQATRLIVASKATADRVCALVPAAAKRVEVIWEAADRVFSPPANAEAARIRATALTGRNVPYLLLIGANTPTKRHDLVISAFAKSVPAPWRLVLLQRRRSSSSLVRLAQALNVSDRVVWLEAISRQDVVTLMQAASGLVRPSLYEGFGLPLLEAMACGCPVIASDIPPFREVTNGTALLVPPGDAEKLAQALHDFVRSEQIRDSLGKEGLERARDFSWDRCAKATLAVYHEAAVAYSVAPMS